MADSFPVELRDQLDAMQVSEKESPPSVHMKFVKAVATYYLKNKLPHPSNIQSLVFQAMIGKTDATTNFALAQEFNLVSIDAEWGTPTGLQRAFSEVSFSNDEKPHLVHERFARAAVAYYRTVGRLPPLNVHHMVLWAMMSGRSSTGPIAEYVHYELFMGKHKEPPPPSLNTSRY